MWYGNWDILLIYERNIAAYRCSVDSVLAAILSVVQNYVVNFVSLIELDLPPIIIVTGGVSACPENKAPD